MGTDSYDSNRHLSNEEINIVLNENIQFKNLFDQIKNADGIFSIEELKAITIGLLDDYILKKIISICGTRELGMTCQDFLYFYALLNTSSAQAKLDFILDFIFFENKKIEKDEYILNIKKYLYNSDVLLKIFLDEKIVKNNAQNNNNEKIKREEVYKFVMENYSEEFSNYKLFKKRDINYQDNDLITASENQNLLSSDTQQNNIVIQNKSKLIIEESIFESSSKNENINGIINNKDETLVINTEMSKNNLNNHNSSISNIPEVKEDEKENKPTINKERPKGRNTNTIQIKKIDIDKFNRNEKLKKFFQKIIKEENGVFPISTFENMLKEINVIQSLIDIIGNFLRQKSQKTFINFQNFKEILNLIIIPDTNFNLIEEENKTNNKNDSDDIINEKSKEEIIDGLFTLFAYPNDVIHKKNFFLFAKSTKPQLSSNTIKDWFNQYKITKFLTKEKFKEIIGFILDELYESFEHIKYLPYIFLKFDIPNKKFEKKCIDVLLKNKSLDAYFQERLQYDDEFYIVDKEFWDNWNLSMNRTTNINYPNFMENELNNGNDTSTNNLNNNPNDINKKINSNISSILMNDNQNQEKIVAFNLDKIADKDGKLKEGLVYKKDFVVLSKRMYQLFYKWYGTKKDIEIKRTKIYLEEEENDNFNIAEEKNKINDDNNIESTISPSNNHNESRQKISISKIHLNNIDKTSSNSKGKSKINSPIKTLTKNYSFLKGINKKTHQNFELEIYPVFLCFFNFMDMQKKDCSSLEQVVETIKENVSKGDIKYYPFSRKSKYIDLLHTLQTSLKITLNKNNARLWTFYKNSFDISDLNDTLEKNGIVNSAIIILELNENSFWPSERLKKSGLNNIKDKKLNLAGLANIGNTCYMNSILQLFLNNVEIKSIFLDKMDSDNKFHDFIINKIKNKNKKMSGELINEFINLLKEKFVKCKKTITPKKFKEICGVYNSTFKGYDQQDAHDFYTFLVDNLHEETNIKSMSKKYDIKEESDTIDTTELELSNEYWANSIRQNASYIYDLFFGQMKSTLTCNECNKTKIKYENFSCIELPIFESKKIIIEIILFRLPFTLSPFNNTENLAGNDINTNKLRTNKTYNISTKKTTEATNNNYQLSSGQKTKKYYVFSQNEESNYGMNLQETKGTKTSLRKKLKKLKIINMGKYADNLCSSETLNILSNEENKFTKIKGGNSDDKDKGKYIDESNLNTALYEKFDLKEDDNKIYGLINKNININEIGQKNELISNPLNLNIPVRLRIEIERNKKAGDIIEILRKMNELQLEQNPLYTEFIIITKNKYVKLDSIIDETFLNFEQVFIYELLNYEGIKKIFGYDDLTEKATILEKQDIQPMLEVINEEDDSNKIDNSIDIIDFRNLKSDFEKEKEKENKKDKNKLILNNNISNLNSVNNKEISEILVAIFHQYRTLKIEKDEEHLKLFNFTQGSVINHNLDFIILTNRNSIKPVDLYEIIWEKYMYFINSPTKYESNLWWRTYSVDKDKDNNNINITTIDYQRYSPFVIKLVKKSTKACIFCPWFRLCQGCILNPANKNYLSIPNDCLINVEWKTDVVKKDLKEENVTYILNHSSSKKVFETCQEEEEKRNIYDCLDLFTREEVMKNVLCEKCNKKTNFKKRLEIDKFPKYLTLILKRFKYTKMFTTKIDNLIQFPLENLDMTNYITPKEGKIKYNLFGVVNHSGTLSGGHYHCDIKQENNWIRYDDSYTCEYDKKIMTENAYLLVYKLSNEIKNIYNEAVKQEFKLNLLGLLDTAYKIYLKQYNFEHFFNYVYGNNKTDTDRILEEYDTDCHFYYGEPITVNGKMGFLINIYKINDESDKVYIKIKVKKGYYETNVSEKKIIKETIKLSGDDIGKEVDAEKIQGGGEEQQSKVLCGSCVIN